MSLHLPFIEKIESRIGRRIPAEFRAWMLDDNAPYPAPSEVSIPASSPWIDRVDRLFAAEEIFNIFVENEALSQSGVHRFPREMLVVGDNQHGGQFLLSLRQDSFGAVYYLSSEERWTTENDLSSLHWLSHSFSEWFGSLVRLEAEDEFEEEDGP